MKNSAAFGFSVASLGLIIGFSTLSYFDALPHWSGQTLEFWSISKDSTISNRQKATSILQAAILPSEESFEGLSGISDSPIEKIKLNSKDTVNLNALERKQLDSLIRSIELLQVQENGSHGISNFFTALDESDKNLVRIWYYGDSQIEGDRITKDIRQILQSYFGGSGLGYIPISNPASYTSLELGDQPDFKKLNCFKDKKKKVQFCQSGLAFTPVNTDPKKFNYLQLNILKGTKYNQLKLAGFSDSLMVVEWKKAKDSSWKRSKLSFKSKNYQEFNIADSAIHGKISVRCKGVNLVINGFYLEGNNQGIQLDNLGIRGHSGDGLNSISNDVLCAQVQKQNTQLIVFHYGNNIVPYLKSDEQSKKWLLKLFRGVFAKYKKDCPNTSFLVIGPGDMGYEKGGEAQSYSSANILNGWLKELSKEQGFSYFDFYSLMKKDGGILGWKKNGWAGLDGHLTPTGQRIFAKKLTSELITAYQKHRLVSGQSQIKLKPSVLPSKSTPIAPKKDSKSADIHSSSKTTHTIQKDTPMPLKDGSSTKPNIPSSKNTKTTQATTTEKKASTTEKKETTTEKKTSTTEKKAAATKKQSTTTDYKASTTEKKSTALEKKGQQE